MWGAVLFVGSVLIFYANAPIIPVIIGCLSVPIITAFRSRLRSKKTSSSGGWLKTSFQETENEITKSIIRPDKLEQVKDALAQVNVTGLTVTEVRGHGRQKGQKAVYRGTEYSVTLLPKIMLELVIPDERSEEIIKTIITAARTGEIGDGRVFVVPIEDGYNVRTGERDVM
jgi:nitrogen regulatory protein PII